MYMLGGVAFILYATAFAALAYVNRGNLNENDAARWTEWISDPAQAEGRMGEALRYALHGPRLTIKTVQRRFDEIRLNVLAAIDRRLFVVNTLVAAAPLPSVPSVPSVHGCSPSCSSRPAAPRGRAVPATT